MNISHTRFRIGVDIGGTFMDGILTIHGANWQAIAAHVTPNTGAGVENRQQQSEGASRRRRVD